MSESSLGYPINVGQGVLGQVAQKLKPSTAKTAVIHTQATRSSASEVADHVGRTGRDVSLIEVPSGEAAKDLAVADDVWARLAGMNLHRDDALISVGGGATTDLVGFVAATWMRGIDVIHCPTTVLAMVDAAIGGKTGINTQEAKNLVGVFHDPIAVICDLDTLDTLEEAEFRSGFAEIVKAGLVGDEAILQLIERHSASELMQVGPILERLIHSAVAVKTKIVAGDRLERTGDHVGRAALNYGHTLGHAIEKFENYRMRHGEAISVGMTFAAALGHSAGVTSAELVARQAELLGKLGLPTTYRGGSFDEIREIAKLDKKAQASRLRFIVLREVGQVEVLDDPSEGLLLQAWQQIGDVA